MSGLEGPKARRGRPTIDDPSKRRWWRDLYAVDDRGIEFVPDPQSDECWFFRHGATALVNHLGKSKSIRAFLYNHYTRQVDGYDMVIIHGQCNDNCVNPRHTVAMDRRDYLKFLQSGVHNQRKNRDAPLYDKTFVDRFGDTIVVRDEAARLYWRLLVTGQLMDVWDWERGIHRWGVDYGTTRPENVLVESALLRMMRDDRITPDLIQKHALVPIVKGELDVAGQNWTDFHDGLRELA